MNPFQVLRPGTPTRTFALLIALGWTVAMAGLFLWYEASEAEQTADLARNEARAFFRQVLLARRWNAQHNGVYVFVTDKTQPNEYLIDPDRDLETTGGRRLTKINPAYMTRQIAELSADPRQVRLHITSLRPIRPANACDPWEEKALKSFERGRQEEMEFLQPPGGEPEFRYMAPLRVEPACLSCHAVQGYRDGDIRGGISLTIPAGELVATQARHTRQTVLAFGVLWAVGLAGIGLGARRLSREEKSRESVIRELQAALSKVKTLSGLLPICAACKKVRDDQGYWQQIENYISAHSEADFTHGICPECARRLYPGFFEQSGDG